MLVGRKKATVFQTEYRRFLIKGKKAPIWNTGTSIYQFFRYTKINVVFFSVKSAMVWNQKTAATMKKYIKEVLLWD